MVRCIGATLANQKRACTLHRIVAAFAIFTNNPASMLDIDVLEAS